MCQAPCYILKILWGFDRNCLALWSLDSPEAGRQVQPKGAVGAERRSPNLGNPGWFPGEGGIEMETWTGRGSSAGEREHRLLKERARPGCGDKWDVGLSSDGQPSCFP